SGNTINGGNVGILVTSDSQYVTVGPTSANVTDNIITGVGTGLQVKNNVGTDPIPTVTAHDNQLSASSSAIDNQTSNSIDATDNWWGCNGGPGTTGCTAAPANTNYTPWLVLTLS